LELSLGEHVLAVLRFGVILRDLGIEAAGLLAKALLGAVVEVGDADREEREGQADRERGRGLAVAQEAVDVVIVDEAHETADGRAQGAGDLREAVLELARRARRME